MEEYFADMPYFFKLSWDLTHTKNTHLNTLLLTCIIMLLWNGIEQSSNLENGISDSCCLIVLEWTTGMDIYMCPGILFISFYKDSFNLQHVQTVISLINNGLSPALFRAPYDGIA